MSKTLRKSCLDCVLKHLGQAVVLLGEAEKGYPSHKYIALGHLGEAEDESINKYPDLAADIRSTRLDIEKDNDPEDSIEDLIERAMEVKEENGSGCETCG